MSDTPVIETVTAGMILMLADLGRVEPSTLIERLLGVVQELPRIDA